MKKVLLLIAILGLLCSEAAQANPKATKGKKVKRKMVKVHTGYKSPLYLSPTTNDILNSTDNSGIGKNSSDNYSGLMNNGSMSTNGSYQNSGVLSKERK